MLLGAGTACSPPPDEAIKPDTPAFSATDTTGHSVTLSSLRGSVVLLNVWATWCTPCRQEIPFLSRLQAEEGARGLRVIGVSIDEAADRAEVLVAAPRLGIRYEIWFDPAERVASVMDISAVPVSALIDRSGIVTWRHAGVLRKDTPGFAQALDAALAPVPATRN